MDGHFVPNITIGPVVIKYVKKYTKLPLDVHLMIENPEKYIDVFISAGADMVTVHTEAAGDIHAQIRQIKTTGVVAGVAINPETPVEALRDVLPAVDLVTVMSVKPGFGGQSFIPGSKEKIAAVRTMIDKISQPIKIEVDGGITVENAGSVIDAGADIIVAGAAVFAGGQISDQIKQFLKITTQTG